MWVFLNLYRIWIDTQICSAQPKQPKFSTYNTEKRNSETYPAQQKQRKQIILADSKNIFI